MAGFDDSKLNNYEIYARESGIYKIDIRLWYPQNGEKGWCSFRDLLDDDKATAIQKMKRFAENLSHKIYVPDNPPPSGEKEE